MNQERDVEKSDADLDLIYGNPVVVQRIREYLGAEDITARYVALCDGRAANAIEKISIEGLESALASPIDLARSLCDRDFYIVHLDIEYVDFDQPESAYLEPERAFALQEPTVKSIEELLVGFGIRPLHLITGQGHHFVWQFPKSSFVVDLLREVCPETGIDSGVMDKDLVFHRLGLVMEYLAGEIKRKAARISELPVEVTAVKVGGGPGKKREMISVDISEYGDPLESRVIRIPFTHYRKPWQSGMVERLGLEGVIPKFVTLPLHEIDVASALKLRKNSGDVLDLAKRALVTIPVEEAGTRRLIEAYSCSQSHRFHVDYYKRESSAGKRVEDLDHLPFCVHHIFQDPNDLLLKPAQLQLVTRVLLSRGIHPAAIARHVRGIFSDPSHRWPDHYWEIYDPGMRSEFYVRLFAGLVATGIDEGLDFNCVSTKEKGLCPCPFCMENLMDLKPDLLFNRQNE